MRRNKLVSLVTGTPSSDPHCPLCALELTGEGASEEALLDLMHISEDGSPPAGFDLAMVVANAHEAFAKIAGKRGEVVEFIQLGSRAADGMFVHGSYSVDFKGVVRWTTTKGNKTASRVITQIDPLSA